MKILLLTFLFIFSMKNTTSQSIGSRYKALGRNENAVRQNHKDFMYNAEREIEEEIIEEESIPNYENKKYNSFSGSNPSFQIKAGEEEIHFIYLFK